MSSVDEDELSARFVALKAFTEFLRIPSYHPPVMMMLLRMKKMKWRNWFSGPRMPLVLSALLRPTTTTTIERRWQRCQQWAESRERERRAGGRRRGDAKKEEGAALKEKEVRVFLLCFLFST
jgi:L-lactate permease